MIHFKTDQWHQHWITRCGSLGRVWISLPDDGPYYPPTRFPQLDSLLPRLSRIDWYAIREEFCVMVLYRSGHSSLAVETDPRIVAVFRELFELDGGYVPRGIEREEPTHSKELIP